MAQAHIGNTDGPSTEIEHHEYHSAVEVDETVGSWKDWVGPGLAVFALVGILAIIILMMAGVSI